MALSNPKEALPLMELILTSAIALSAVIAMTLLHYEILRSTSRLMPHLATPSRNRVIPRNRILVVITAALLAHFLEVGLYATLYYGMHHELGLGRIAGAVDGSLLDYFYFSLTTFTTLGVGDVYPEGPLRIVAGVESLNGLVLIGWSASFTYLAMEKFWDLDRHPGRSGG